MSNNPKDPWDELEGRFFKVDVGSTTDEAITNDYNTSEPVVHYTTDGNIVFNGMKFCKQKEDAVSSDKRIVVHKAIPMLPRKSQKMKEEHYNTSSPSGEPQRCAECSAHHKFTKIIQYGKLQTNNSLHFIMGGRFLQPKERQRRRDKQGRDDKHVARVLR